MRWIPIVTLLLLLTAGPANADAQQGWAAYLKGDYAAALKELKPLADAGDRDAEYYLGTMYSDGHGVPRSSREAAAWFEKAAQQGQADAQFSLGFALVNGAGEGADAVPADPAAGVAWLEKAGGQGNVSAAYYLGYLYWTGTSVPADRDKAISWSVRAADLGDAAAQYQAGAILASTPGAMNAINAYKWFELAARKGEPRAAQARDKVAAERLAPAEVQQAKTLADAWHPR